MSKDRVKRIVYVNGKDCDWEKWTTLEFARRATVCTHDCSDVDCIAKTKTIVEESDV